MKRNYETDSTGAIITNIPYSQYINDIEPIGKYAVPNINPDNSGEINSAILNGEIKKLADAGGGIVYIPAGTYRISTIELKNNITLFVSKNAKLVSLTYEENIVSTFPVSTGIIFADGCKNIEITGGGVICGNGKTYTDEPETSLPLRPLKKFNTYKRVIEARKRLRFCIKGAKRNPIIHLKNSCNIKVHDIILNESAEWTFVIDCCNNAEIYNLVIDNIMYVANTDGIDIKGGQNININHCFIATADDAIVLKPVNGEIHNINVDDCVICSYANCFKIGTETSFDVSDIYVKNCYFFIPENMTCGGSGIAIESADGSNVKNVFADNIEMYGVTSPILIWLGKRLRFGDKKTIGSIRNVCISNITAVDTELPSAVTGCRDKGLIYEPTDIVLKNINVTYRDTDEELDINPDVPEWSMADYPDIIRISHIYKNSHLESDYWDLPCYGIFVRYASNVDYGTYKCKPRSCNTRPFDFVIT